jgi:hypothetical protein
MPQPALDYLDAWAVEVNREAGWNKVTRSDLIREIVLEAIERRKTSTTSPPPSEPSKKRSPRST